MPSAKLIVKSNEAGNCFVVAWLGSLTAFNASPLKMRFQRDLGRALSAVEIYGRTNILVFVYDDQKDRAVIWDEQQGGVVHTVTPPPLLNYGEILTCHFRQDYLVLIMTYGITVYEVEHWRLVCHQRLASSPVACVAGQQASTEQIESPIENAPPEGNPFALGELVVNGQMLRLIYPAGGGQVANRTFHLPTILSPHSREPLATEGGHHLIRAHHNDIAAMALSADGRWIATASLRGTVIRLWSTTPGVTAAEAVGDAAERSSCGTSQSLLTPPLAEVRRGLSLTNISGLAFGPGLLAVAGGTGTVHLYPLSFLKTTSSSCQVADPLGPSLSASTDQRSSTNEQSKSSQWWRQLPGRTYLKTLAKTYLPQYLRSTGSQLQISASESCNILHVNAQEIVLISPSGQYQKFGYRLGSGEGATAYWPLEAVQLASPAL